VCRMSEGPRESNPADTQMFKAFVERGEQETSSRRWVLPVTLVAVLAVVLAIVLIILL
jgi:hypothetical protein